MESQTMAAALAATVLFILVVAYLAKRRKSKTDMPPKISPERRQYLGFLSSLDVALLRREPNLSYARSQLKRAQEAGLDWRKLYQHAVGNWPPYMPKPPSEDEVNPEGYPGPPPPPKV